MNSQARRLFLAVRSQDFARIFSNLIASNHSTVVCEWERVRALTSSHSHTQQGERWIDSSLDVSLTPSSAGGYRDNLVKANDGRDEQDGMEAKQEE